MRAVVPCLNAELRSLVVPESCTQTWIWGSVSELWSCIRMGSCVWAVVLHLNPDPQSYTSVPRSPTQTQSRGPVSVSAGSWRGSGGVHGGVAFPRDPLTRSGGSRAPHATPGEVDLMCVRRDPPCPVGSAGRGAP